MHIVTDSLHCVQLQLGELLLSNFSKKKDNTKMQFKILNGSLPLEKHTSKWTKNNIKCP